MQSDNLSALILICVYIYIYINFMNTGIQTQYEKNKTQQEWTSDYLQVWEASFLQPYMHTNCSEADYNFNDDHARPGNLLVTYYIYRDDTFLLFKSTRYKNV